jgi:PKD domain
MNRLKQPIQKHKRRRKYNMRNNMWFKLGGAALLGLVVLGLAVPSGQTETTVTSVTLAAVVMDQQCQGGDNVNVTLTATLNPPAQNVQFQWDFNNDGIFDTPLSSNPTVTHLYPDETNVTAVVKVVKGRRSATDSVTFSTMRCGG